MKKFIKSSFLLVIPILLLIITYTLTDPYKKIWTYKNYICDYIMLNRGDVSTRVYLKNKDKIPYNSFIFGSSRSTAHTSREWSKYLSDESIPYSYGSWSESIKGTYKKIALVDSLNSKIDNAFIVIDDNTFTQHYSQDISSYDHYLISGDTKIDYHLKSFYSYITNPPLLITSIDFSLFHKKRSYMKGFIGMNDEDLDPVTNDWMVNSEKTILSDSIHYFDLVRKKLYVRGSQQTYFNKQITTEEKIYLLKIKQIFLKHNTDFKIVIAPLYDQKKINPQDLSILDSIFNAENIYDYSGINKITNDYHNYASDLIHYRKKVGDLIFKDIYSNKK